MIYYCMALYPEATSFIEQLALKKCATETRFQIFENETTCLMLTGVGSVQAAVSATYLFARRPPAKQDLLVNVGICGSAAHPYGTCFYGNKLIEQHTGRTFYPDLLLRHPFREAAVTTCPVVLKENPDAVELADQEATGIYQAGKPFFHPHQMAFFKIVSDAADGTKVSGKQVEQLVAAHAATIIQWAKQAHALLANWQKEIITKKEQQAISKAVAAHGLTLTRQRQMQQLLRYYKLNQGNICDLLKELPGRGESGKQEGKQYLEQLRDRIL